jgi:hypothetical protein
MSTGSVSRQCPVCDAAVPGGARSCPACGLDLIVDELAKIAYTTRFLDWASRYRLLDEQAHARLQWELDRARGALAEAARVSAPATQRPSPASQRRAPAGSARQEAPVARVQPAEPASPAAAAEVPPQAGRPAPVPRAPRGARPKRERGGVWASRLRRAWRPVASDLGLHGLAYLGVLLMFTGTLGLALFSLRSVNTSLRPLAEVSVPLVLLVSSWFLRRWGAPLGAASLELLGGAVLPILTFASLLDGSSVPPDLPRGPLLLAALAAIASGLAGVYALAARRRPATMLRYLVAPLAWTTVGVIGLAFHRGPSAAQMALVSVAVAAPLLIARRWRDNRLSRPTEIASMPGVALAFALVLMFAAAEGWPLWPALTATAATLLTVELLAGGRPGGAAGAASLAQSLVLGVGLAAAAPRLGWTTGGAALLAGSLVLLEWHARRRPDPLVALVVLAVAAAGLALAMAQPWTAVTAATVTGAWAHTRRIRRLPGPLGQSAEWTVALAVAGCLAPLGLVSGLERALPEGRAWVVLAGLTVLAVLAVRRWRPADQVATWLVTAMAALAALATVGERLTAPVSTPSAWLAVAAGLGGAALALTPRHPVLRTWSAAAALAWSTVLGLEAAGMSLTVRSLVWAAVGLALVGVATAWRSPTAGHLAAIGHLAGLGALALAGFPRPGLAGTVVLAAWVAAWLVATVAAELGAAPLIDLLARVAGERTWLARAARALPAVMVVAGLPPLVVMSADLAGLLEGGPGRFGVALALLALAQGAVARPLRARRPLADVLALAGSMVSAAAVALALADPCSLIASLASAIGVVVVLGPELRRPPMTWWAWTLTAPLALLLADRAGVAGDGLRAVLGGWGALLLLGGLFLDDLLAGRRKPGQWLRLRWLDAPAVLGALGSAAAIASAAVEPPAVLAAWCLAGAACSLVVAMQLRAGAASSLSWELLTTALVLLRPFHEPTRPWLGVLWAAMLVGASWLLERRERATDPWLRWDLPPLVVAHAVALAAIGQAIVMAGAGAPGAPVPAGARMQLALTASGAGLLACAVAAWRRGWPWAFAGVALTLGGAWLAGPGWLALALAGTAVGTALAAARSGHPLRGGLQVSSVIAGGWAWLELLVWASLPGELAIGLTALAAGSLTAGIVLLIRAGRLANDWATPIGLLATVTETGVLVAGGGSGAVVGLPFGVPFGLPGLAVAAGWGLVAAAAGLTAKPLGRPALRLAAGLLALGALQILLAAGRTPPARWSLATLALAVAATASCLAVWWTRRRTPGASEPSAADHASWSWSAFWLDALKPLAGAAAGCGLLAAAVDGRRSLLAAGLLVVALEAAAGSLVLARPGLGRLAPPLACGAWLELTGEAIGGDAQWLTLPVGLTLLVVVEMTRAQYRRVRKPLVPELRLLEHAGMLLVVGAALVQTLTRTTSYGLVAGLLGIGLCVWGAATRVRRRVTVGSVTLLLALFGMIAVPVAQAVPEFHAAALWIVLTVVGLVLIAIAVSLEQGRTRLAAAVHRIDQLLQGWE